MGVIGRGTVKVNIRNYLGIKELNGLCGNRNWYEVEIMTRAKILQRICRICRRFGDNSNTEKKGVVATT